MIRILSVYGDRFYSNHRKTCPFDLPQTIQKWTNVGPGGDLLVPTVTTTALFQISRHPDSPLIPGLRQMAPMRSEPGCCTRPRLLLSSPSMAQTCIKTLASRGSWPKSITRQTSGTWTFLPAYRESDQDYQFAGPGFAPAKTNEQNDQTSLELRFATDLDGRLNGILGAFYIEEDISTSTVFAPKLFFAHSKL